MADSKLKKPIAPLKRPRHEKPALCKNGESIIERGADTVAPSPSDTKTKDISIPLNEYYHKRLEVVTKTLSRQVGATISRRSWAAGQLMRCIDNISEELNLNERGEPRRET